jgi:hypothetical protein
MRVLRTLLLSRIPKIRMDDAIIETVTKKWPSLGLPGSGKPVWKD